MSLSLLIYRSYCRLSLLDYLSPLFHADTEFYLHLFICTAYRVRKKTCIYLIKQLYRENCSAFSFHIIKMRGWNFYFQKVRHLIISHLRHAVRRLKESSANYTPENSIPARTKGIELKKNNNLSGKQNVL